MARTEETISSTTKANIRPEHKILQHKINIKTKARFGRLVRPSAWKWSRHYTRGPHGPMMRLLGNSRMPPAILCAYLSFVWPFIETASSPVRELAYPRVVQLPCDTGIDITVLFKRGLQPECRVYVKCCIIAFIFLFSNLSIVDR